MTDILAVASSGSGGHHLPIVLTVAVALMIIVAGATVLINRLSR
jgi:hypothetical protein